MSFYSVLDEARVPLRVITLWFDAAGVFYHDDTIGRFSLDKLSSMDLRPLIPSEGVFSTKINHPNGDMELKRTSYNDYSILLTIPPFIIGNERKYYSFDSAGICMPIKTQESEGTLFVGMNRPKVLVEGYRHPYVNFDGTIYFGPRFDAIEFGHWYDIQRERVAKKLAALMWFSKGMLEMRHNDWTGYTYRLDDSSCKILEGEAAERLSKVTPLERIVHLERAY